MEAAKGVSYLVIKTYLRSVAIKVDGEKGKWPEPIVLLLLHSQLDKGSFNGEPGVERAYKIKDSEAMFVFFRPETKRKPEFRFNGRKFAIPAKMAEAVGLLYTEQRSNAIGEEVKFMGRL